MSKNAINFSYTIKNFYTKDISYNESFTPYSINELKSSPLFSIIENKFKSLFENESNFIDKADYDFLDEPIPENILPETANILMDAVYCTYIASFNLNIDKIFDFENKYSVYYLEAETSELKKIPNITFSSEKYIAIYTELIKYEVFEIKYVISVLYNLYNLTETINRELANEFLRELIGEYYPQKTVFDIFDKSSLEKHLLSYCNYRNFQNNQNKFELEFDFKRFDRFISLLKKYRGYWDKEDFTEGTNCFCLIHEGKSYYFSLSGYNDCYKTLGEKIENDFKSYFPNNLLKFCDRTDNMLSYGDKIDGDSLVKFDKPKKFSDQKNILNKDDLKKQYSCCERKIFPHIKKKSDKLYIYCKYEPCLRCKPAIEEIKKQYTDTRFYAFEKNSVKLKRQILKQKNRIFKQPYIVRCEYF